LHGSPDDLELVAVRTASNAAVNVASRSRMRSRNLIGVVEVVGRLQASER
jgi:hypothetical protein